MRSRRDDDHDGHPCGRDDASKVKQTPGKDRKGCFRVKPPRNISERQQNPNFGTPEFCERKPKDSQRVRGKIAFDREQQKSNQHAQRNLPIDITRSAKPANQEKASERINHVIDIKAVTRTLLLSHACQSAVEAVTEPIDREKERG